MPVYVRRRQAATPDTLGEFSTDDDDFIVDPDQCRDLLPQPFRLVAKLLDAAIDDIWQSIADREDEREAERRRVLPPQYGAGDSLEGLQRVNCVCGSPDNEIVFIGQSDGIAAVRVGKHSQEPLDTWQNSEFDITALSCSVVSDNVYLLAANDDMGVARLFGFAGDRFLLLKIMNDTEGDKKVLATKIDLSVTSEFCALSLENPGTGEAWLEIHKLPKEAWTKELEGVVNTRRQAAARKAAAQEDAAAEDATQTQRSATAPGKGNTSHKPRSTASGRSRGRATTSRSLPPPRPVGGPASAKSSPPVTAGSSPVEEERTVHKFSGPTLTLRCRPTPKITGNAAATLGVALKTVDSSGDVLGTGAAHPLSVGHLDQRQVVFDSLHEQQLSHLPSSGDEPEREFQSVSWHFLSNGRSLPYGLELSHNENGSLHTAGVAVWWRGGRQLFIFSLVRPAKEVEHRPEQLLPFSSAITASCVSPCSSLLAVGLASGQVLLHDWHLGLVRRVVRVSDTAVWRLRFLGPLAASPDTAAGYPPYKDRVDLKLLLVTEEKMLFTLEAGPGFYRAPVHSVATSEKHQHEKAAWVDSVGAIPGVVIRATHAGVLVLHDVIKEKELCRLVMPENVTVTEPWQPQLWFPAGSKFIYVRGTRRAPASVSEDGEAEESSAAILVSLDLSSVPELGPYFEKGPRSGESRPAAVHPMVVERANALLELRLRTHPDRTAKLQSRWQSLRETFKAIQERKVDTELGGTIENDEIRSVLNSTPLSDFQWKE